MTIKESKSGAPTTTVEEMNTFFRRNPRVVEDQADKLESILLSFLAANEDPSSSPNLASTSADDMSCLTYLLSHPRVSIFHQPFLFF